MVTLGEARKVIAAAEQKAAEIKQPMNIAVVWRGSCRCSPGDRSRPSGSRRSWSGERW
jgi:hypothetical protein